MGPEVGAQPDAVCAPSTAFSSGSALTERTAQLNTQITGMVKRATPEAVLRRARRVRLTWNRYRIRHLARRHNSVLIRPANRVEHYFHFVFDLVLPLWHVIASTPHTTTFGLRPFGIFTDRVIQLFPRRVAIVETDSPDSYPTDAVLQGMNPHFVPLSHAEVASLKTYVFRALNIVPAARQDTIILVERLPPDPYFVHAAQKKGAGASRRSIPNHQELAALVKKSVPHGFRFVNAQLERMTFAEQVKLFDRAAVVIGQHGAGLGNVAWVRQGAHIYEISHAPELDHFRRLARVVGCTHAFYRTTDRHQAIDVEDFAVRLVGEYRKCRLLSGKSGISQSAVRMEPALYDFRTG